LFAGPVVTEDFFSINIDMENPGENQWFLLSLGGKTHINWLVVSTPLKHRKVSWDDYSQLNEKKCSKPPQGGAP
jgi:hypothetical protein